MSIYFSNFTYVPCFALGPIADHFADCETPGDYFLHYFDESTRHDIIYQTNLYINQRQRHVSSVTHQEFLRFIGINFIMGYHKLPSRTDYWKGDQDLTVPLVVSTMPRNRFGQILSNLHINENNSISANNTDKLYKLRPLISKMNQNYVKLYNISERVSIDESMILFKGRHSIKQYNPQKPIKRGNKLWMRADNDGYITKFDLYQGKSGGDATDETCNIVNSLQTHCSCGLLLTCCPQPRSARMRDANNNKSTESLM